MDVDQITIPHRDPEEEANANPTQSDETPGRTDLIDLVKEHRERRGISLRDFEQRTIDPATGKPALGHGWLHKLETDKFAKNPTEEQLRWLARGLDLPYKTVSYAAAAQYYGIENVESEDGQVRSFVKRVERMTAEERSRLQQLMDIAFPSSAEGA